MTLGPVLVVLKVSKGEMVLNRLHKRARTHTHTQTKERVGETGLSNRLALQSTVCVSSSELRSEVTQGVAVRVVHPSQSSDLHTVPMGCSMDQKS